MIQATVVNSIWPVAFCVLSAVCILLALTQKPARVGILGLILAFVLIVTSTFALRRSIEFLLVPVTGAYLIALYRSQKLDGRAALGGSFAPLFNLVAAVSAGLLPSAAVLLLGLGAAWRAKRWSAKWIVFGSTLPTVAAILLLFL